MSKRELVNAYLNGHMDRRQFIKALGTIGISAVAAVAYAHTLGLGSVAAANGLTRNKAGYFVTSKKQKDSAPEYGEYGTPDVPTSKEQCKDGGYQNFIDPSTGEPFKNQGQCIQYVNTGK